MPTSRWNPDPQERLVSAAVELFRQHGYDAVTVTDIAEKAGLTRRSFFRHSSDKREVLFAGSRTNLPGITRLVEDCAPDVSARPLWQRALSAAAPTRRRLAALASSPRDSFTPRTCEASKVRRQPRSQTSCTNRPLSGGVKLPAKLAGPPGSLPARISRTLTARLSVPRAGSRPAGTPERAKSQPAAATRCATTRAAHRRRPAARPGRS